MMLVPPLVSRKPNNALHSITCSGNERRSFYGCTDLLRFLLVMDSSLVQPFAVVYIRAYAFELPAVLSTISHTVVFVRLHAPTDGKESTEQRRCLLSLNGRVRVLFSH